MISALSRRTLFAPIALVFLAIVAFGWGALYAGFVSLDDGLLITGNDIVRLFSLHTVFRAFTSYDPELYIPLTILSYQLNHLVFGLAPWAYHLTNLFLHAGSAVVLFFFVRMLFGRDAPAFFVAAIFAIHPLHTEAVLWASARKDVLSAFFFLLTLFLYEKGVRTKRGSLLLWSLAAFLCALLSKATVVVLPVVLILLDVFSQRRIDAKTVLAKWPWFALSIFFGIVAIFGKTTNVAAISFADQLLLGTKSVAFYLGKIFWPMSLGVAYPQITPVSMVTAEFLLPIILCVVLIVTAVLLRKYRMIAFGVLFFFVTVFPNFFNAWRNGMLFFASDRYAYVPSIGIFLIVAWFLSRTEKLFRVLPIVTAILCAVLIPLSFLQAAVWKDSETLYRHSLAISPESSMLLVNLGDVLVRKGKTDEGFDLFVHAAEVQPTNIPALTNIGNILKQRGDRAGAMERYRQAAEAVPKNPFPEHLLGHYLLGEMLMEDGKTEEGLKVLREAADLGSRFAEPSFNLGLMLESNGRIPEAIAAYKEGVSRQGDYLAARYRLAGLLAEQGNLAEAKEHLEYIVARNPNYEKAREHLQNIERLQ